jgi:hypothetical protein
MKCGSFHHTDNVVYTSMPPQVKCGITGRFHYYEDECDCAVNDDTAAIRVAEHSEEELEKFKDYLNGPACIVRFDDLAPAEYYTSCIICGEAISVCMFEVGPKVCESCKKAVKFIKEHFRYED